MAGCDPTVGYNAGRAWQVGSVGGFARRSGIQVDRLYSRPSLAGYNAGRAGLGGVKCGGGGGCGRLTLALARSSSGGGGGGGASLRARCPADVVPCAQSSDRPRREFHGATRDP